MFDGLGNSPVFFIEALIFILGPILLAAGFVIGGSYFLATRTSVPKSTKIAVGLGIVVGVFFLLSFTTPFKQVSSYIQVRYLDPKTTFTVYEARYTPSNYSFEHGIVAEYPSAPGNPYYSAKYSHSGDNGFSIYEYDIGKTGFHDGTPSASTNCGPQNPELNSGPPISCLVLGQTPKGKTVYYDTSKTGLMLDAYLTLGTTRISMSPALESKDEMLKFFNSFRPLK